MQQVQQWLQIVYGKADQVKQRIDVALLNDDIYRRRRVMRVLDLPQRFPLPHTMKDSSVVTWVQWIREESNKLIAAIDDEITRRQDPDDPFDGTASGIFPPLQNVTETQQKAVPKKKANPTKIDESTNHSPQTVEGVQGRLVDVQSPPQRQVDSSQQQRVTTVTQSAQVQTSEASQNQTTGHERQGEALTTTTSVSTQRRVEESQPEAAYEGEQQVEDPFRTLRSFHEKQRVERQGGDQPRTSISSQSTVEGATGGVGMQCPKPQRLTKKHQTQGNHQQMVPNHQRINQSQQNNYYPDPHNNTAYMELPSSIQGKICGKCGLMGHIKRFCKEDVYCKYCRVYTHSTTACRTYPATSSRKNTPEKRTSEDIDQEVNRRVQQEMLRIITDLSTNRQVAAGSHGIPQPNQQPTQKGEPNSALSNNTPYQHIPEQRQGVQNVIGESRRPPEVIEQERMVNNNPGQPEEYHDQEPILNQQWGEQTHLQPPMRPTEVPNPQAVNNANQATSTNNTAEVNVEVSATQRRVEESRGEQQDDLDRFAVTNERPNTTNTARNRRVEQTSCACCNCHSQPPRGDTEANGPKTGNQRLNLHTEYEDGNNGDSKFFRGKRQNEKKSLRECQIIRILPDENDDYMDIVRDSVSAQNRVGPKPMFVNNYYVGDNNWRTVPQSNVEMQRHFDESRSKASTGVQTAVSFLGEESENSSTLQTGLARVKSISTNEA